MERGDVMCIYHKICNDAHNHWQKGDANRALSLISIAASFAYNYNQFFSDLSLEKLLAEISTKTFLHQIVTQPIRNRCVFIDTDGADNRGLTQQYLRALMINGFELLYIYESSCNEKIADIICEVKEYNKGEVCLLGSCSSHVELITALQKKIINYSPSFILLHLMPWDVDALSAIYNISGIKKYNINLTDEAFWLGVSFFDYNIEFRNYGYTLSLEKRGFKEEQLLYLPYYPIFPNTASFSGFNDIINKAPIKILTGGSYYKFFDRNDTFFQLMDRLLESIPTAIIILAGGGDLNSTNLMNSKLGRMKYGERVIRIGNRKDINEVFRHCDLYLSSYPVSGGLMTQYAAINAIPILSYSEEELCDNDLEELVCFHSNIQITFHSIDKLVDYAIRLVDDANYRTEIGKALQKSMMQKDDFNRLFLSMLNGGAHYRFQRRKVDYQYLSNKYMEIKELQTVNIVSRILAFYKLKSFYIFRCYFYIFMKSAFFHLKRKISR